MDDAFKTTSYLQESQFFEDAKMSVLLRNTDKGAGATAPVRRQVDPSADLGKLDVCFGGFTPMALSDGLASTAQVLASQNRERERLAAAERAAAVEAARASEPRRFVDECGNAWSYVVLDDAEVRIERCECAVSGLVVPDDIEGKPVVAIAAEACAEMPLVESICMPDAVVSIGRCAFRGCDNLRTIRFSESLASFDSGWLRACRHVESVALPGRLGKLTPAVFDLPALKRLELGASIAEVAPGAFGKSQLSEVSVDERNESIFSDGRALYSKDGSVLLALAVPSTAYDVAPGCIALARKAFSAFAQLQQVALPDSVELVGDFAFSKTAIASFDAPPRLRAIGERAFFGCTDLVRVALNEGLESLGSNAFSDTLIEELRVPASVIELGHPVAAGTGLTYSGAEVTFSIGSAEEGEAARRADEDAAGVRARPAQVLVLDEQGVLYRNADDGLHLVRALEPQIESYDVRPGTVAIDEGACAKHPSLARIAFPDGLQSIGKGAFKDCRKLVDVVIPGSLQAIDDEAFLGTNIASVHIPAGLTRIGSVALVTEGAHRGLVEPSLRHVEVDPANPRYYMHQGLLVERLSNGSDRVILCTGEVPDVVVPSTVTAIAQYAFNGVRRLRTLGISDRIQAIDVRGIAFDCLLDNIHVDLVEPVEGRTFFDFRFPATSRAAQQLRLAFGSCSFVDVAAIFGHYDNAIVSRSGFDAASEQQLSAYEQGVRVVERLRDPGCMTPNNRSLMETSLRNHLVEVCVDAARHDDTSLIEGLLDLGFVDGGNIAEVIEAVSAVQDASVTNYLLEQKQRRFGASAIDFDL